MESDDGKARHLEVDDKQMGRRISKLLRRMAVIKYCFFLEYVCVKRDC